MNSKTGKRIFKTTLIVVIAVVALGAIDRFCLKGEMRYFTETLLTSDSVSYKQLKSRADSLKSYCAKHRYNTRYGILVDMSRPNSRKRFYLVRLDCDSIVHSSCVAHGCGGGSTAEKPVFSNEPESHCSSLGKYRIGERSYSQWGINVHYKLHGLESTNSNAFARTIVLHSFSSTNYLYSWGCPIVDDDTMRLLDKLLQKEKNVKSFLFLSFENFFITHKSTIFI